MHLLISLTMQDTVTQRGLNFEAKLHAEVRARDEAHLELIVLIFPLYNRAYMYVSLIIRFISRIGMAHSRNGYGLGRN